MKKFLILTVVLLQNALSQKLFFQNDRPLTLSNPSLINKSLVYENSKDIFQQQVNTDAEKKNIAVAVIYSLLLPGMGELYAGDYSVGKYFTIAEAGLWITMGAYQWYATGLRDDSRRYALQHAQINMKDKTDEYFVDIGEFKDVYSFNDQILRKRESQRVYDTALSYWNWDSDANREAYRLLRVSSEERFNDMKFVAAAIGINHLISAINAARLAIAHNGDLNQTSIFNVHASIIGGLRNPSGIMISVSRNF